MGVDQVASPAKMSRHSIAFIVPGYKGRPDAREYQAVRSYFERIDIPSLVVPICWDRTTISENVRDFLKEATRHPVNTQYVFGFSFGALIALLASTNLTFKHQILCSLSPCFREDLAVMKPSWKRLIGKRRANDLMEICSMEKLAHVKTPTTIMVGEREPKEIIRRSKQVYAALNAGKRFVAGEGTRHNLSNERYLKKLTMIIPAISDSVGGVSPSRGEAHTG